MTKKKSKAVVIPVSFGSFLALLIGWSIVQAFASFVKEVLPDLLNLKNSFEAWILVIEFLFILFFLGIVIASFKLRERN